ncbi:MAG: DEAD/DEAH box helicase, partial [Planctomycetaceae bacterium]
MPRSTDRSGHRSGAPRGHGRRAPHHPRPRPVGDGHAAGGRDAHEPPGAGHAERARSAAPSEPADEAPAGGGFAALGLCEMLLRAVAQEGYSEPTPIQRKAIPHVLAGRDLFGCAQTGTGKTAAFALPIIERLAAERRTAAPKRCRVLVLAPTRELAAQIHDAFRAYGRHAHLKTAVIYGGVNQNPQARALARGVDVLVATPGRLLDLVGQRLADLVDTEVLVLDEADRMLDMGFIHDVRRIVGLVPRRRQTLFFSATLPAEVRDLADAMLRDPLEVKTAPQATPAETVAQSVFHVAQKQKKALLVHLLAAGGMPRVIVFTRTKRGANKLAEDLVKAGVNAAAIHGNKSQNQREKALADFKGPRPPVLVATDIAARGIDVDEVSHVVNYELPHEPETYVHRIGRTGRAGLTGAAIAFCDREERDRLDAIERLLRREIPVRDDLPADLPRVEPAAHGGERSSGGPRPQGRSGGRGGRSGRSGRPDGGRTRSSLGGASSRGSHAPRGGGSGGSASAPAAPQFREATGGGPLPRPQGGSKVSRRY